MGRTSAELRWPTVHAAAVIRIFVQWRSMALQETAGLSLRMGRLARFSNSPRLRRRSLDLYLSRIRTIELT